MDKSKSVLKREAVQQCEPLEVDKCREEFEKLFIVPIGVKWVEGGYVFVGGSKHGDECYSLNNVFIAYKSGYQARQSEIDALKAQVEGLILKAGDMEKLAIEHMLERDAALIQVDELKAQVEELKANAERWQWLKQNNAIIIEFGVDDWKFTSTDTNAIKQKVYRRTGWTVSTLPIGDEYETMDEAVDQAIQQQKGEE